MHDIFWNSQRQGGHGSVRLRFVHGTFRAVPVFGSNGSSRERVSRYFSRVLTFQFRFRFLETAPAVPVPLSFPRKTVPTVPVSGPGSVPGPSCKGKFYMLATYRKWFRVTNVSFFIHIGTWLRVHPLALPMKAGPKGTLQKGTLRIYFNFACIF